MVGFGARRLFDDDQIQAKYLNTSESPIYKKSQVLFGLDLAKREIARRHQVVVVEGYTDVMAMHASGVPTAVASCGTAFGTEHITVLRRLLIDDDAFRGEVIFTFDGDEAGQKAALKAFDEDQQFAAQTFIAIAPDGMDPCELRQAKGEVAVRDLVARRQPLFAFAIKAELAEHNLDTAEGRVEALRRTVPMVARIKEMALRDEYARQLAGWVGWEDTATVVRRVRETAGGGQAAPARPGRQPASDPNQGALAVEVDGPPRPNPRDPQLHVQREVLKARAAGARAAPARCTTRCRRRRSPTPRTWSCTGRSSRRAARRAGWPAPALLDAVAQGAASTGMVRDAGHRAGRGADARPGRADDRPLRRRA